jgi:hypothetical protein
MPQVINFPDTFDDDNSLYTVVNNLRTRLTGDITDVQTSIPVLTTSGFPAVGFITILSGPNITNAEAIAYSGTNANNFLNAERGSDGTEALEHFAGENVDLTIVSRHHNNVKDAIIQIEQFVGTSGQENFLPMADDKSITVEGTATFQEFVTYEKGQRYATTVSGSENLIVDDSYHFIAVSGVDSHLTSVSFDGSTERMQTATGTLDFGDAFSIGVWVKRNSGQVGQRAVLRIQEETGTANRITILKSSVAGTRIDVGYVDSASGGSPISMSGLTDFPILEWLYFVATWDKTSSPPAKLYGAGSQITSNAGGSFGNMANTARRIGLAATPGGGTEIDANIYQVHIWDKELTQPEIAALYNNGNPGRIDPRNNFGNYTSAGNLQHFYRLGKDSTNIGKDEGAGTLTDFTSLVGITTSDISTDIPESDPGPHLTITLPTASGQSGRHFIIKESGGNFDDSILISGSETIDRTDRYIIDRKFGYVELISDGEQWNVVGSGIDLNDFTVSVPDPLTLDTINAGVSLTISGSPVASGLSVFDPFNIGTINADTIDVTTLTSTTITADTVTANDNLTVSGIPVATGISLNITETDGDPYVTNVHTIVVTTGTLTDDGGGQVTIATGGSGGGGGGSGNITDINDQTGPSITITGTSPITTVTDSNVITIGTDAGGFVPAVFGDEDSWRGFLLTSTSGVNVEGASTAGGTLRLPFDEVRLDTDNFFDAGFDDAVITVPAEVTRMRFGAKVQWDSTDEGGSRALYIRQISADKATAFHIIELTNIPAAMGSSQNLVQGGWSEPVTVTGGQLWETIAFYADTTSATSIAVGQAALSNRFGMWFAGEVIEPQTIPDSFVVASGIFTESLTISGAPVATGTSSASVELPTMSGTGISFYVPDAPPVSGTSFDDEFDQNPEQPFRSGLGVPIDSGKWTKFDNDSVLTDTSGLHGVFSDGMHLVTSAPGTAETIGGYYQTSPGTSGWQIVAKVGMSLSAGGGGTVVIETMRVGIFISDSNLVSAPTTADLSTVSLKVSQTEVALAYERWNDYNSVTTTDLAEHIFDVSLGAGQDNIIIPDAVYLKIGYDTGSDRLDVGYSLNGQSFIDLAANVDHSFGTNVAHMGFFVTGGTNGANSPNGHVQFFRVQQLDGFLRDSPVFGRRVRIG